MKSYWSIPGPSKAPRLPCIAFNKPDGTCLSFMKIKKKGWDRFATRNTMFDRSHPEWGPAIELFMQKYAEAL
ncbi:MAG: hypothetical protein HY226_04365 [Candidatus Vogelbacteria bacterium]|nr:hypothetical protein [Candidatus Vogelbacteria bacterium]